jgi:hypothetical protein
VSTQALPPQSGRPRWRSAIGAGLLVLASLIVGAVLIEGALLVSAGFGAGHKAGVFRFPSLYVSNRPIAEFDRIMGYRRLPGPTRIVEIMQDQLVFDHTFTPNNRGYISARDYSYRKSSPDVTRLIVFGDSFTAAEFNDVPWPDRVQDALHRAGGPGASLELYSFAVNGAGLGNWHSIFFDDVIPHYEFDAVVIASFGDDLARAYSILHYVGNTAYTGRFPTRPADDADFQANYLPHLSLHPVEVASDAEIDRRIASLRGPWHWPGFKERAVPLVRDRWQRFTAQRTAIDRLKATAELVDANSTIPLSEMEQTYGAAQFGLLLQMIAYCHEHNIPVVLVSIPTREGAHNIAASRGANQTVQEREIKSLAQELHTLHYDGYRPFSVVPSEDIDRLYWLTLDGHWNQRGSDLFAAAFTTYLQQHAHELRGGASESAH